MKKILMAAAACALFATAGCSTTTGPINPTSPPVVSTQGTLVDEKALYTAEAAYNVAASAYLTADSRDQLSQATQDRAKAILKAAYDALLLARTAYAAGDASTFGTQAANVVRLAGEVQTFLARN